LGAIHPNDLDREGTGTDRRLMIMPGHGPSRTTLNGLTGIYGSDASGGALRLRDEHRGDLWYGCMAAKVGLIIPPPSTGGQAQQNRPTRSRSFVRLGAAS
jgi:hypothetical protein